MGAEESQESVGMLLRAFALMSHDLSGAGERARGDLPMGKDDGRRELRRVSLGHYYSKICRIQDDNTMSIRTIFKGPTTTARHVLSKQAKGLLILQRAEEKGKRDVQR